MTRFARAKGSKADNERRPMEATAWSEVKKQLKIPADLKEKQKQGNKKRLHFNPEDEDDDFVPVNGTDNSAGEEAGSGDEAVEEEEEKEEAGESEPEVRNAKFRLVF